MTVFQLKDGKITDIKTSFEPEHYDEGSCPTCGGEFIDASVELRMDVETDMGLRHRRVTLQGDIAKEVAENIVPWVLNNQEEYKNVSVKDFLTYLESAYSLIDFAKLTDTNLNKTW